MLGKGKKEKGNPRNIKTKGKKTKVKSFGFLDV